jgi:hypothetical protein
MNSGILVTRAKEYIYFFKYDCQIDVGCRRTEITGSGNRDSESQILTKREDENNKR